MRNPTSILITGASSGLGAALAETYAGPGIRLVLGGRDVTRLEETAARCRSAGAEVEVAAIDVTDAGATTRWVEAADDRRPLDLVIANAGISAGSRSTGNPPNRQEASSPSMSTAWSAPYCRRSRAWPAAAGARSR